MKMDRNTSSDGVGKYALLHMRRLEKCLDAKTLDAINHLNSMHLLEYGNLGAPDEFFVVKLRDTNAYAALKAYADKADETDHEWANEVRTMLPRAGENNQFCQIPD